MKEDNKLGISHSALSNLQFTVCIVEIQCVQTASAEKVVIRKKEKKKLSNVDILFCADKARSPVQKDILWEE